MRVGAQVMGRVHRLVSAASFSMETPISLAMISRPVCRLVRTSRALIAVRVRVRVRVRVGVRARVGVRVKVGSGLRVRVGVGVEVGIRVRVGVG